MARRHISRYRVHQEEIPRPPALPTGNTHSCYAGELLHAATQEPEEARGNFVICISGVTVEKSALGGPTSIGSFKHLPPTLTLKYNFMPGNAFRPYVGAGLNITLLSDTHLNVPTVGRLDLDTWSFGPAAQAGFDYKMADHWYWSADIKWAMIRSDIKFQGTKISQARIDPLLFGIGVGYRFGSK